MYGAGAVQAVTEASGQHIAGYHPQSRSDVDGFMAGLPDLFRGMGADLSRAASNMEEEHIHKAVIELVRELAHAVSGIADPAEQAYATHAREHKVWLDD